MPSIDPLDLHTDFASENKRASSQKLDADHAAIEYWTNQQLLPALARVIRDDDTLVDAVVRARNLHPDAYADLVAGIVAGLGNVTIAVPADNSVTTVKIADGAVTAAKLSGVVTTPIANSMAALKAVPVPTATIVYNVLGYYAPGDLGGGFFRWNSTDATADNGGTVIQLNVGGVGRFNRIDDGITSVRWFGAKGDGATDDKAAIASAIAARPDKAIFFAHRVSDGSSPTVYYCLTAPTLTGCAIYADPNVQISLPSTNGVSFAGVTFVDPIGIISRDRNNMGSQIPTAAPGELSKLVNASRQFSHIKPVQVAQGNHVFISIPEGTNTATPVVFNFLTQDVIYPPNTVTGSGTATVRLASLVPVALGDLVSTTFRFIAPETLATAKVGCFFAESALYNNWGMIALDKDGNLYVGTSLAGVWAEASSVVSPALLDFSKPIGGYRMSARFANGRIIVCLNGSPIADVALTFTPTLMGFGENAALGAGQGQNNCQWTLCFQEPMEASPIRTPLRVACFGDSITTGEAADSWARMLSPALAGRYGVQSVALDNYAVSGSNSTQTLTTMSGVTLANYDVICIMVGSNEVSGTYTTYKTNLNNLLALANSGGRLVVVGLHLLAITQAVSGQGYAVGNTSYQQGATMRMEAETLIAAAGAKVVEADTMSYLGRIGADNWADTLRDNLHPQSIAAASLARCFADSIVKHLANVYTPIVVASNAPTVVAVTLLNGWTNLGGGFRTPRLLVYPDGHAELEGIIAPGSNIIFGSIPVGYAPKQNIIYTGAGNAAPLQIQVDNAGSLRLSVSGIPSTWLSLCTGVWRYDI